MSRGGAPRGSVGASAPPGPAEPAKTRRSVLAARAARQFSAFRSRRLVRPEVRGGPWQHFAAQIRFHPSKGRTHSSPFGLAANIPGAIYKWAFPAGYCLDFLGDFPRFPHTNNRRTRARSGRPCHSPIFYLPFAASWLRAPVIFFLGGPRATASRFPVRRAKKTNKLKGELTPYFANAGSFQLSLLERVLITVITRLTDRAAPLFDFGSAIPILRV